MSILQSRTVSRSKQNWFARKSVQTGILRAISLLLIGIGGVVLMIPLVWMVSTSLKTNAEAFLFPPRWMPKRFLCPLYHTPLNDDASRAGDPGACVPHVQATGLA